MTDLTNPPAFSDPGGACPKCLRSSLFTPRYRDSDGVGMGPATITWTHECGYSVVTLTAQAEAQIRTGKTPEAWVARPAPAVEIREGDLDYADGRDHASLGVRVRVTHRPSGFWGEATGHSVATARSQARENLMRALLDRTEEQR